MEVPTRWRGRSSPTPGRCTGPTVARASCGRSRGTATTLLASQAAFLEPFAQAATTGAAGITSDAEQHHEAGHRHEHVGAPHCPEGRHEPMVCSRLAADHADAMEGEGHQADDDHQPPTAAWKPQRE